MTTRVGVDRDLRIDTVVKGDKSLDVTLSVLSEAKKSLPSSSADSDNQDQAELEDRSDYVPRWARSSKPKSYGDNNDSERQKDSSIEVEHYAPTDELPPFADEASKALYREIKLLERQRDEAARSDQSHKERISIINDHLRSIRQEIDHTNSLVSAKKSEVNTEEHLLSLSQRELGQTLRDTSAIESSNLTTQNNVKSVRSQIKVAEDELEKLRTDLNWNQEELEQWATAATKKEEESLALQKYTLSDELKIKDLTLTIEDLTKQSVETKALLENEVTETKSNQSELEKLAERFESRHDERRQLLQQWKDTIESMNDRDDAINQLAGQYAGLAQKEEDTKKALYTNKDQYEFLEVRLSHIISSSRQTYFPLCLISPCHFFRVREKAHKKTFFTKSVSCKVSDKTCPHFKKVRTCLKMRWALFGGKTQWWSHQLRVEEQSEKGCKKVSRTSRNKLQC